ncbi:MAG: U32 family peptidase, partial [Syntrophothermus sp.]
MNKLELMSPAGDWTMLTAAVMAGANAVYFGVDKLNMRAKAQNFTLEDLPQIAAFCKEHDVKTYLTLNTIVFDEEIEELDQIIPAAKNAGITMVICWDMAVVSKCREYDMPFAVSTQASISNSLSAQFFKDMGAKRIVLARECSLDEVKKVRAKTDLEIEVFIHGAMCIAVSGRCFMSHHLFGKSANRGECIQPCRRDYEVKEFEIEDKQIDKSMVLGDDYVLSPKDLCSIEYVDLLIEAGINSFKIEGRKRSPEYVAKTTAVYRRAIDLYFEKKLTPEIKKEMLGELGTVYNRGFSSGFYFEKPSSEEYAGIYGSLATTKKVYSGKVINYFKKSGIVHIKVESGSISSGDDLLIIGPSTGVVELKAADMINNEQPVEKADKGDEITFKCPRTVRPKDMVYLVQSSVSRVQSQEQ